MVLLLKRLALLWSSWHYYYYDPKQKRRGVTTTDHSPEMKMKMTGVVVSADPHSFSAAACASYQSGSLFEITSSGTSLKKVDVSLSMEL